MSANLQVAQTILEQLGGHKDGGVQDRLTPACCAPGKPGA
jgi:hypothetical protein